MGHDPRDIDVVEDLQAIRNRPEMYVGAADAKHSMGRRLVELATLNVAADAPPPLAVRLIAWSERVFTVGFDGEPLPIGPYSMPHDVSHPELYRLFMYLGVGGSHVGLGGAVLNALSERLHVCTLHGGDRYAASFRRGGLYGLLGKTRPAVESFGTSWMTFKPDETVVPGVVSFAEAREIIAELEERFPDVGLSAIDRTDEKPYWF